MFDVRVGEDGLVHLVGRLDAAEAENASRAFEALHRSTTFDCGELEYISSAGIEVLIRTYKRLNAAGQSFKLVRLIPRVRNVFMYAGLDRILTIE